MKVDRLPLNDRVVGRREMALLREPDRKLLLERMLDRPMEPERLNELDPMLGRLREMPPDLDPRLRAPPPREPDDLDMDDRPRPPRWAKASGASAKIIARPRTAAMTMPSLRVTGTPFLRPTAAGLVTWFWRYMACLLELGCGSGAMPPDSRPL
ncbi:MAG: hypothetical protein H6819_08205 [Phycisphaerales bacterium]|nr:hypothetical protein [Phycisphaerales bacterium]MCB9854242.1 hypothetical protein [Phycisphaerales bacterium]MCB9864750.1 hypothetical protein [Phycisphaerales bacterium]